MVKVFVNNDNKLEQIDTVANVDYALRELSEKVNLTYDRVENEFTENGKISKYYYQNELKAIIEIA